MRYCHIPVLEKMHESTEVMRMRCAVAVPHLGAFSKSKEAVIDVYKENMTLVCLFGSLQIFILSQCII